MRKDNRSERKKVIERLCISGLILGAVILAAYLVMKYFGLTDLSREELQEFIKSTGAIAPLVFIFISFLQVTFVPIPGWVSILAGNYVFGFWESFLYSYIGMFIGSVLAYWLGRLLGRPYINWVAGSKEEADKWMKKLNGRENAFLFFAFLFPAFPDDLLCSVAGVFPMSFPLFIVMQLITRATSISATILFMSGDFIPYEGWGLWVMGIIVAICIVIVYLGWKNAKAVNRAFDSFIDFFSGKKPEKKADTVAAPEVIVGEDGKEYVVVSDDAVTEHKDDENDQKETAEITDGSQDE